MYSKKDSFTFFGALVLAMSEFQEVLVAEGHRHNGRSWIPPSIYGIVPSTKRLSGGGS